MAIHANPVLRTAPASSTLYDVLDLVLDKGLVVDLYARLSIVGIEVITLDARVVVASVDTYLRFADVVNRLDLEHQKGGLFGGGGEHEGGHKPIKERLVEKAVDVVVDRTVDYLFHGKGKQQRD